jgi:hypothetical protein
MLNSLLVFTKIEPDIYIIAKNVYNTINYLHLLHSAIILQKHTWKHLLETSYTM